MYINFLHFGWRYIALPQVQVRGGVNACFEIKSSVVTSIACIDDFRAVTGFFFYVSPCDAVLSNLLQRHMGFD